MGAPTHRVVGERHLPQLEVGLVAGHIEGGFEGEDPLVVAKLAARDILPPRRHVIGCFQ